jgi:histone-lysine N-methyltransferase SETD3
MSGNSLQFFALHQLSEWLSKQGFPNQDVKHTSYGEEGIGLAAGRDFKKGETALQIPENYTVTGVDVVNHPVVAAPAAGRGDLIGLTLWLMYERSQGEKSMWYPYLQTFPTTTLSPLLWSAEEQQQLLKGSPALEEVQQRTAALEGEYEDLESYFTKDPQKFPQVHFSLEAFKTAFSIILSRALYLPAADLFALVPFADALNHRADCEAYVDFSMEDQAVVLTVDRNYKEGEQVFTSYGRDRSNADFLITYGFVDENNPMDYLELEAGLVDGDRLQVLKQQILQQSNFDSPQSFPLYLDRFPTQLLTYMRLSRLQDPALFSKIVFEKDIMLDQANEYEVLMILMGECRTRLGNYDGGVDDEIRLLKNKKITQRERVAAQLRLSEKKILTSTMTALRTRLAPIRGIPTKGGGLKDPNADINEMFDMVEQVASAPKKFFDNMFKK